MTSGVALRGECVGVDGDGGGSAAATDTSTVDGVITATASTRIAAAVCQSRVKRRKRGAEHNPIEWSR